MTDYAVICANVRSPCYSASTASSYQIAAVSPLPGPSTLLGTLGSALAHVDLTCQGATVDEAAQRLFQRFEQAGLWATCRMAPDNASTKGSVILKRSLELERRGDESRSDARRREWVLSQELEVFYAMPQGDVLAPEHLLQAACLLDRIGDTESLIGVTYVSLLRDIRPSTIGNQEVAINTTTPGKALQGWGIGGYVLRSLQSQPNLSGLPRPNPEPFFLPIVVETQRGLDTYRPSQFRGLPASGADVLQFTWQGGDVTVVVPPADSAPTKRRRGR